MSPAVSGAPAIPPPTPIPPPPADPSHLDPLLHIWPAGERVHRCYDVNWGACQFYAGDSAHRGRFHPFAGHGTVEPVKVLYGADDVDGALSETVFHDVPVRGDKHVPHAKLVHRLVVELVVRRDLVLFGDRVDLTELEVAPAAVPLTLGAGAGLEAVCEAANRAGITVTGLVP